jgi:hypothetical protein
VVTATPDQGGVERAPGSPATIAAMDTIPPLVDQAPAGPPPLSPPAELAWSYNPWRANWRRPVLALLIELGASVAAGWSFSWPDVWPHALGWGGFSILLLFSMTAPIFIPARYKLDAEGVMVRFLGAPGFRKWAHYRNYYVHDTGVHMTTMPKPSRLDPFRGHYLQYGVPGSQGERALVVPFIKEHLREYLGQPPAP